MLTSTLSWICSGVMDNSPPQVAEPAFQSEKRTPLEPALEGQCASIAAKADWISGTVYCVTGNAAACAGGGFSFVRWLPRGQGAHLTAGGLELVGELCELGGCAGDECDLETWLRGAW